MDAGALIREVDYFHRNLFRCRAPEEVAEQYVRAHRYLLPPDPETRSIDTGTIIGRGLDAEAVEFFLRLTHGRNRLTQKFQILFYLVEIRPEYYDGFVNERKAPLKAVGSLTFAAVRSAYKYVKGNLQARRHHVV